MGNINKDSGISTSSSNQQVKVWNSSGTLVTNLTQSFRSHAERRYKVGVSIPNFHARVKRGELLPHTPFAQVEWSGEHLGGDHHAELKSNPLSRSSVSNFRGPLFPVAYRIDDFVDYDCDPTSSPSKSVPDYFLQQAASRIYSGGFDALTASAEAKKTASMFKGVSRRMVELAQNFSTKRMLKLWLEGRYGWRTLAYDVRDLHSALTEFDAKREIWTERAGTSETQSSSATVASTSDVDFTYQLDRNVTHTFSLRGSVSGLIKPNRFVVDPVKTGWERVPYSFVVDWVYGVGVALDTMRFLAAATAWTASKGFQCTSTLEYNVSAVPKSTRTGSAYANWKYTGTRQVRSPATTIPTTPQVTNRRLTWDLALDLQALARVRSRFK